MSPELLPSAPHTVLPEENCCFVDVPQGHLFEWWSIFFNSLNANTRKEQSEPTATYIQTVHHYDYDQDRSLESRSLKSLLKLKLASFPHLGPKWRERAQGKLRKTRKARRMDKSQKPKSALTARPHPFHGAPAPRKFSFGGAAARPRWRARTTPFRNDQDRDNRAPARWRWRVRAIASGST
ncbi:hypothetical protein PIB30_090668 [Stylosanthes scabra]|uniref:Uncharacterized protein n=1 Tax=Stylosanthes scabra TaxID=79078 RepID=A0ABU6XW55_9FABA|nr:hypothetical protein [Stylosanthes scabra]